MAAPEPANSDSGRSGPPRWVMIPAVIGLVLLAAVALWTLAQALRESAKIDDLRVNELSRAADNLATWPATAGEIGRTNLFPGAGGSAKRSGGGTGAEREVWLYHPELGEFSIRYTQKDACGPPVEVVDDGKLMVRGVALPPAERSAVAATAPAADLPEDADYAGRARRASLFKDGTRQVCFEVGALNLRQIVTDLGGFDHMLLVRYERKSPADGGDKTAPEGEVVAQIGPAPLPIERLSDLPRLQSGLESLALTTAQTTLAASGAKLGEARDAPADALAPIDSRVAGKRYRFYLQPVALSFGPQPSGPIEAASAPRYYLVGAAPESSVGPGLRNAHVELLAFALAVALLMTLVPVIKLSTLGPVDGLKPIDVALVGVGLLVAVAVAATAVLVAYHVQVARAEAAVQLRHEVDTLRSAMTRNITTVVNNPAFRGVTTELTTAAASATFTSRVGQSDSPFIGNDPRGMFVPDSAILLDQNGRQPLNSVVRSTRARSGADFKVPDRDYFRRALDGETVSATAPLRQAFAERWKDSAWKDTTGGLVFDQIRSRQDGVPKTVIAAALACGEKREQPACGDRGRAAVLRVTFVMTKMLAPPLPDGVRFAVVDARSPDLPVLFHSDRGRARIERMSEGLNAPAKAGIAAAARAATACGGTGKPSPPAAFEGLYEGDRTIFAAAPFACTDWVVVAMKSRARVDRLAAFGPLNALIVWMGLIGCLVVPWSVTALVVGDRAWCWLWPTSSAGKQPVYQAVVAGLTGLLLFAGAPILPPEVRRGVLIALLLLAVALVVPLYRRRHHLPTPAALANTLTTAFFAGLRAWRSHLPTLLALAVAAAVAALAGSLWGLAGAAAMLGLLAGPVVGIALHRATCADRGRETPPLTASTQGWFAAACVLMLATVAALPVAALSRDAAGYFAAMGAGDDARAECTTRLLEQKRRIGVARAFDPSHRWPLPALPSCMDGAAPDSITGIMRNAIAYDRYAAFAKPARYDARLDLTRWAMLGSLALVLAGVLLLGIWSALRGLFGFGVAIEAIAFPAIPEQPGQPLLDGLPARTMVIAPNDRVRRALLAEATTRGQLIDLFEATAKDAPVPPEDAGAGYLLTNLEMLFRDPERRLAALRLFERLIARQEAMAARGVRPFRLCLIAELSPLDRLLQSYEREAEELDDVDPAERSRLRAERGRHREDVRWSRLFESFATYIYAAAPRPLSSAVPLRTRAARTLWREFSRLPDHAVAAVITGGGDAPVGPDQLATWVNQPQFREAGNRALIDYLSSMLIEHYHFAWSVSSRAERLLLYRFSYGHIPNMARAYALRTLVRRGLVVLDPYPRIMNRSFAQFVRHAEKPTTLRRWRQTTEVGGWRTYRLPLAAGLLASVGVIAMIGLHNGDSATSLLPLLVAAGPVLINALGSARRSAAA